MNALLKEDHKCFREVLEEAQLLRWSKLQDYGLCYGEFGILGLIIKVNDKCSRIKQVFKNNNVNNESLRDSAIDLLNYSAMLVMELDKKK